VAAVVHGFHHLLHGEGRKGIALFGAVDGDLADAFEVLEPDLPVLFYGFPVVVGLHDVYLKMEN
jgi:hypothetical protein